MKNLSESKLRIKILKNSLTSFEKSESYARYMALMSMSKADKAGLWGEWNGYYKKVRESRIGRLIMKQKEAFYKKEIEKTKQIVKWTNENITMLISDCGDKPLFSDPYETLHKVGQYLSNKSEYESLKNTMSLYLEEDDSLI